MQKAQILDIVPMAEQMRPYIAERGRKSGAIFNYPQNFIEKLRNIRVGGIPGSIFFSMNHLTNNHCHPVARLATFALPKESTTVVRAKINSIRSSINDGQFRQSDIDTGHSYVKTDAGFIIDTTRGEICTEDIYNELESPHIIEEVSAVTDENFRTFRDSYIKMLANPKLDDTALTAIFMPYVLTILKHTNYNQNKAGMIIREFCRYAEQIKLDEIQQQIRENPSTLREYATAKHFYGGEIPEAIRPYCEDPSLLVTKDEELFKIIMHRTSLISNIMLTFQKRNMVSQAVEDGVSYTMF